VIAEDEGRCPEREQQNYQIAASCSRTLENRIPVGFRLHTLKQGYLEIFPHEVKQKSKNQNVEFRIVQKAAIE
jgi:hypothetical protein